MLLSLSLLLLLPILIFQQIELNGMIDKQQTECLNESDDHRLEACLKKGDSYLESDCDEQVRRMIYFLILTQTLNYKDNGGFLVMLLILLAVMGGVGSSLITQLLKKGFWVTDQVHQDGLYY